MGLWAASLLGIADAGAYARDLGFSTLDGKAQQDLAIKLRHDFDAAGVAIPGDELRLAMPGQLSSRQKSHSSIACHDSASVRTGIDSPPIALGSSFD